MTKRAKIIIGVFVGVLGAILAAFALLVGLFYFTFSGVFENQEHLPDEVLIRSFYEHRSEFEQLRSMIERDNFISRIDDNWSDPPNIAPDKLQEYRRLFAVVGTPRGLSAWPARNRIQFIASSRGWVASGSSKGYVYLKERPKETVSDLDRFHNGAGALESSLRHIEGDWYLFFER